jgi:signal transduction histidine kinase
MRGRGCSELALIAAELRYPETVHPLRVLLYVSLVLGLAVAWAFGFALMAAGVHENESIVLSVVVFVVFVIPWSGVFWWAVRRAADLDELTSRTRWLAEGGFDKGIADRAFHGEVDDLARAVEGLRTMLVRQRAQYEAHRAAMAEIVASLGEGLLAVDRKGRVVVANPRVAEMFDVDGTLVGKTAIEVARKQPVVHAIDCALRGEASVERLTAGSSDNERQIEVRAFPVAASLEIAAVALFIDVTQIEKLQRVRRDFLDDFSHEVRTPLAGLRSAAETLQQGGLSPDAEEQLRNVMQRQLARIERLVKDVAELNQIESGDLVLQRKLVSLREVVAGVCEDFQNRAADARIAIRGDDVEASIDEARAQQIFMNLLDNAWKHGGRNGDIAVEVTRDAHDALVRVSDHGPGIPQGDIDRIFHRFFRVDRSRSTPGTGLGLAIAKHLAALHGGSIHAWNRPEGGATFEVRLPIR